MVEYRVGWVVYGGMWGWLWLVETKLLKTWNIKIMNFVFPVIWNYKKNCGKRMDWYYIYIFLEKFGNVDIRVWSDFTSYYY